MAAANPFQALEIKLSAGTPIEAILEAVGKIIEPITKAVNAKRETMSQSNRDRLDLLEVLCWENALLALGFVRVEQLNRPPAGVTITGAEPPKP
jgi:hypothetical protein